MERQISIEELITEVKRLILGENISCAIELCTKALKTQPLNSQIYQQRAILYMLTGDTEKSKEDVQKAKKLNSLVSHNVLEGMVNYVRTVQNNENNADNLEHYYKNAQAALEKKPPDLISAYAILSEIIRRDKKAVRAYSQRADVLYALKQYEQCADDCRSAIALDENNLDAFIYLSKAHFSSHHYIQACAASEVVLSLDKSNIEGHYIGAMACYELKKYQQAIEICTQYLAMNSESSITYCARACCYFALGELQKGEDDYQKAIILNTVLQETYLSRIHEAKMMYRQNMLIFVDQEPKTNLIHYNITLLDERAESFKKYVAALKTLMEDHNETDAERVLSQYCLAELYAKCRFTYLHKFKNVCNWPAKNEYRIQMAACHYIIVLDKLINGVMFNQLMFSSLIKRIILDNLNNCKLNSDAIPSNSYDSRNQLSNPMTADEIISSKVKLCLDVVLGISHLYLESLLSRQCIQALKNDFRNRLISCLNNAIPIIIEKSEDAQLLFDHLASNPENIFVFFQIKIKQNRYAIRPIQGV
jgi:tetratricopeptide (TPR) repeat protein